MSLISDEDEEEDEQDQTDQVTTTTAQAGTLRALADEQAGAEGLQTEGFGVVGSSIDFLTGDSGTVVRSSMTDAQADQRQTGVVATDEGGAVVSTDGDGNLVGGGPNSSRLPPEVRAQLSSGDSDTHQGWITLPNSIQPGDKLPLSVHIAKQERSAADNPMVQVAIFDADTGDRVANKYGEREATMTPTKYRIGTVDGLSPGRYTAKLALNATEVDRSTVLEVGGGGGGSGGTTSTGATSTGGAGGGGTYRFESDDGTVYQVPDLNGDGQATAADLTTAMNRGTLEQYEAGAGSSGSTETGSRRSGGVDVVRASTGGGTSQIALLGLIAAGAAYAATR